MSSPGGRPDSGWHYAYAAGLGSIEPLTRLRSRVADVLVGLCDRHSVRRVIDLGCGDGSLASALAGRVATMRRMVLVEPDAALLAAAGAGVRLANPTLSVDTVRADIDNLPLRALDASPTLVIASHVLYYSADWRCALSRLLALSSDDVLTAVVTRTANSASYRLRRRVASAQGGDVRLMTHAGHVRQWWTENGHRPVDAVDVDAVIRVRLPSSDESDLIRHVCADFRLRQLLTLLCHTDPGAAEGPVAMALNAELATMVSGSAVELVLQDTVLCTGHLSPV
jgi:SAM-dependent methyltransferase